MILSSPITKEPLTDRLPRCISATFFSLSAKRCLHLFFKALFARMLLPNMNLRDAINAIQTNTIPAWKHEAHLHSRPDGSAKVTVMPPQHLRPKRSEWPCAGRLRICRASGLEFLTSPMAIPWRSHQERTRQGSYERHGSSCAACLNASRSYHVCRLSRLPTPPCAKGRCKSGGRPISS